LFFLILWDTTDEDDHCPPPLDVHYLLYDVWHVRLDTAGLKNIDNTAGHSQSRERQQIRYDSSVWRGLKSWVCST